MCKFESVNSAAHILADEILNEAYHVFWQWLALKCKSVGIVSHPGQHENFFNWSHKIIIGLWLAPVGKVGLQPIWVQIRSLEQQDFELEASVFSVFLNFFQFDQNFLLLEKISILESKPQAGRKQRWKRQFK